MLHAKNIHTDFKIQHIDFNTTTRAIMASKMIETPCVSAMVDASFLPSCSFAMTTDNITDIAYKNLDNTIADNNKYSSSRLSQLFVNVIPSASTADDIVRDVIPTLYRSNTTSEDIHSRRTNTNDNVTSLFSLIFSSIIKYSRKKYTTNKIKSAPIIINCHNRQTTETRICRPKRLFCNYISGLNNFNNLCVRWILFVLLFNALATITSTTTMPRFNVEERRIVRTLFLKKFGLESLASEIDRSENLSKSRKISNKMPNYIWELYERAEQEDYDTIRHYSPMSNENVMLIRRPMSSDRLQLMLTFNLSEAIDRRIAQEQVVHADLRISPSVLINCLSDETESLMNASSTVIYGNVNVYEYERDIQNASKLITTKRVDNKMQWLDFDVSNYLSRDQDNVEAVNFIIEFMPSLPMNNTAIKCQKLNNDQTSGLIVFIENIDDINELNSNKAKVGSINNTRRKRNAPKLHKKRKHRKHSMPKDNNECRRTELYVDFGELNWQDWIMAPVGYEAYQCRGRCPHPMSSHFNTTNHAIIQSLINSIDPNTVPQPSCVPVEMSAISILYRDINNVVVVKTYPDMKVEACGCH